MPDESNYYRTRWSVWLGESKGAITAYLCEKKNVDWAVRTGATNAGHCVVVGRDKLKMQQLPVGFVNPKTRLVIGAGALVDPAILRREIALIKENTDRIPDIYVDYRAGVHLPVHAQRSTESGRHHLIGATGKGASEALIDRIKGRGKGYQTLEEYLIHDGDGLPCVMCDTEQLLNDAYDKGDHILLEGTQGTGLDLCLGPYPYTTHKQTGPAQWMMEAGLSPSLPVEVVMVVRTFPIRVAGNSGPLPREISWPRLAREINEKRKAAHLEPIVHEWAIEEFETAIKEAASRERIKVPMGVSLIEQGDWADREMYAAALSELNKLAMDRLPDMTRRVLESLFETTTVTKKLRRVARLDLVDLKRFARQTRPTKVAITFMNYVAPQNWYTVPEAMSREEEAVIGDVEDTCGAPVKWVSYGPGSNHITGLI